MATVFDYLRWRADVPFSVASFNPVDNLILSELSYTDFAGIVPPNGISLREAHKAFFASHTREEIQSKKSFTAKAPLLMDEMIDGCRFGNIILRSYIDEVGPDIQLSAVTFDLGDGTSYVAFRGTDGTLVGWKEDFNFSFLNETLGQKKAVTYLNSIEGHLRVGGHSKGGNLAIYASAFCGDQDKILEVYSNDGPGFREQIINTDGFHRILPKVKSIIPDTSVIGLLLSSEYPHQVVKSSASGIVQHDGFTWQVTRRGFEEAALSDLSILIEKTVSGWLAEMDDAQRESFTEIVFSLFESTGQETFSAMSAQKWKTAESIVNAVMALPKEKQQEAMKLLTQLGQSSGQAAINFLSDRLNKQT